MGFSTYIFYFLYKVSQTDNKTDVYKLRNETLDFDFKTTDVLTYDLIWNIINILIMEGIIIYIFSSDNAITMQRMYLY